MPDEKVTFDVFLSHNSKDKPAVRQIADALEGRAIRVWLDERELPPGVPWQDELENIIQTVRSAAVLVGQDGLGPWEMPEMRACLSEMVDRKLRVIPVLLTGAPSAPQLPLFLKQNTWVDFRNGITDEELDRLEWGITGKKPVRKVKSSASVIPPRLHNLPFSSLGDLLKGRDEELRKLQDGAATAITQAETIYGLGGIGKTRLAVEHAWRSGSLYDSAFFVVAESPEALRANLADLARPDLLNLPEHKTTAQDESVAAVLRWLREHDRWLLILDNVDTKEAEQAVVKVVPSLSAGRVLITSRIKDWPATVRRQPIETLSLEEAQRFILERTARDRSQAEDDPDQALRLAEQLGGLPLALEQAAAYISQQQMSLSEYLEEWEKEREKVLNWYDGSVMQYPDPVAVTWQKTFQQLSSSAAAILRLTAYLAPDPIPSKMFEDGAEIIRQTVRLFCEEVEAQVGDYPVKEAVAELGAYSMVTRKGESFTVHRMVQDALQSKIPETRRRDWIEHSLKIVDQFAPTEVNDIKTWPVWGPLCPHAVRIVQYADDVAISEPTSRLRSKLAIFLLNKGLFREAEPLIRRALQIDERFFGPQYPNTTVRLSDLARSLQATNQLAEAESMMWRVLQIYGSTFGPQHPIIAKHLNDLAYLLRAQNRLMEAKPLMKRVVEIWERSLEPNHPATQFAKYNLSLLLEEIAAQSESPLQSRRDTNMKTVGLTPGAAYSSTPSPTSASLWNRISKFFRAPS